MARRCFLAVVSVTTVILVLLSDTSLVTGRSLRPHPGPHRSSRSINPDLEPFFTQTGSEMALDLVVLMDRSRYMSATAFYVEQKTLVESILRYYVNVESSRTRVAVVTFGDTATVVINDITSERAGSKCEMFGEAGAWSRVVYNDTDDSRGAGALPDALHVTDGILEGSKRPHAQKMLLLAWDGSILGSNFSESLAGKEKLISNYDASIFAMAVGPRSHEKIGNILVMASDQSYFGETTVWWDTMDAMPTQIELYASENIRATPPSVSCFAGQCNNRIGYMECICAQEDNNPCNIGADQNQEPVEFAGCSDSPCGDRGLCRDGNDTWLCLCYPGYSGRFCEVDVDECEFGICQNGAACRDRVNRVDCDCPAGYCGDACEYDVYCPTVTPTMMTEEVDTSYHGDDDDADGGIPSWLQYILISLPGVLVIAILFGMCYWMCTWISKNVKEEGDDDKPLPAKSAGIVNNDIYDDSSASRNVPAAGAPLRLPTRITRGVPAAAREISRRLSRKSILGSDKHLVARPIGIAALTFPNQGADDDDRYHVPVIPDHLPTAKSKPPPVPKPELKPKPNLRTAVPPAGGERTPPPSRPPPTPAKKAASPPPGAISLSAPVAADPILLPSPPPARQKNTPDVVRESCLYQNLPQTRNMDSWVDYVADLIQEGNIDKLCIVQIDKESDQWICTQRNFLLDNTETQLFTKALDKKQLKKDITLKRVLYTVEANDGRHLVAASGNNVCLCVGRTKTYMICVVSEAGNRDACQDEVKWVLEHIQSERM